MGKGLVYSEFNRNTELRISNYPNPFNPSTTINYNLPDDGNVTIKIYDILGRELQTLVNNAMTKGSYYVIWNGKDKSGRDAASGIYFYSIEFNNIVLNKKMLLIR